MKLTVEQSLEHQEVEITIKCNTIDPELERLIAQIRLYGFSIQGRKDNNIHMVKLEDIYYFESVDDKTFMYRENDVLECDTRLYALGEQLIHTPFVRISKAIMLNTAHISYVKSAVNGRFEVHLDNGEAVIVNRHYMSEFKAKFDL